MYFVCKLIYHVKLSAFNDTTLIINIGINSFKKEDTCWGILVALFIVLF